MPSAFQEEQAKDIGKDKVPCQGWVGHCTPLHGISKVPTGLYIQRGLGRGRRPMLPTPRVLAFWGAVGREVTVHLVFSHLALAGTLRAGRRPVWPNPTPHRGHLSWVEKDPNSQEWFSPGSRLSQSTASRLPRVKHLRTTPGARPGPQPSEPQGSQWATKV